MKLPGLREELCLLPGPLLADGQPSHTLHDPVRNLFFQIDWPTFEILRRWHLRDTAVIASTISKQTPLQLGAEDIDSVAAFFHDNQLLQPAPDSSASFAARLQKQRGSLWQQLLHNYLFFRIPLVKPDRWLGRWAPSLNFFFSRKFLLLTVLTLAWGLMEVYRHWDSFTATLVDTLSLSGMLSYGTALLGVKVLHELGHAFTAKRLGCKVPAMGVAFLVMCPVAYTDTNEVWKLTERRQRLAVVAAGVLTELAVAAWATLAWAILPAGLLKSMAFLLATTTWVATLAINTSPFMRFDGYFILSDWLGLPNLHARAFALARWDLRERLFNWGVPPPEHFSPTRRRGLILFAYGTWFYRLAVFLGIAALVYTFFIKAIGILLFAVEIGWFVLLPLYREMSIWRAHWGRLRQRPRAWRTMGIVAFLSLLTLLPWPTRLTASGLLHPKVQLVIYAPPGAQVVALPVAEGQRVTAGTLMLQMQSPELAHRLVSTAGRIERLRWQTAAGTFDALQRAQWQVSREQLSAAEADMAALQADAARYAPTAPFDGVLRDLSLDLRPGTWLKAQEPLARLVADQGHLVTAYVDEEDIARIAPGQSASFHADSPQGPVVRLEVLSVDADASRTLPEPELASLFGGNVVVREKGGQFHPEHPIYRVTLKVIASEPASDTALQQRNWRGKVTIAGEWASPGWRYLRSGLALLRREAGF